MTEAEKYLADVRKRVAKLSDLEQVRALAAESERLREVENAVGQMRREVLQRMREGRSVADLAEEVGVSRARLYRLLQLLQNEPE